MRRLRPLPFAICLSLLVHLLGFWHVRLSDDVGTMPDSAPRLVARFAGSSGIARVVPNKTPSGVLSRHRNTAPRTKNAEVAQLNDSSAARAPVSGPVGVESAQSQPAKVESAGKNGIAPDSEPTSDQSDVAEELPPTQSEPVPEAQEKRVTNSHPVAVSAPAEKDTITELTTHPVAEILPRDGKVTFTGTAGGVLALNAMGAATWSHDGHHFQARLSAGFSAPDSALDYSSEGVLQDTQMLSLSTRDNRRGKLSIGNIDLDAGKVVMQRGQDTRERRIKGLAVAISALPEMLMVLDDKVSKAAFFVVGDFWVDDAIVVQREPEYLRLPVGRVRSRHYATRTHKGDQIDVWLASGWRNAPVRILIRTGGMFVDLKAAEVMIDGNVLAEAPDAP